MGRCSSSAARILGLVVFLCAAPAAAEEPAETSPPCPEKGDVIAVLARRRELWLCQNGTAVAMFKVALGRGGLDKHSEGDGRTPLGWYALGTPRPSTEFGTFIPIEYPTSEQIALGFTGSRVGIHGPPRGMSEPEYPLTTTDWTRGCIATGLDDHIEFIAEFVRQLQPILVVR